MEPSKLIISVFRFLGFVASILKDWSTHADTLGCYGLAVMFREKVGQVPGTERAPGENGTKRQRTRNPRPQSNDEKNDSAANNV
jgi:hypothetical protein